MRLFVYGVLLGDLARGEARSLVEKLGDGFHALAHGALYAVEDKGGWFPAFVPDPDGGEVFGRVHDVEPAQMAAIDIFERVGDEYDRRSIQITGPEGFAMAAGAYCWIRPVDGLERIGHGDFARWLKETGRRAYGA